MNQAYTQTASETVTPGKSHIDSEFANWQSAWLCGQNRRLAYDGVPEFFMKRSQGFAEMANLLRGLLWIEQEIEKLQPPQNT